MIMINHLRPVFDKILDILNRVNIYIHVCTPHPSRSAPVRKKLNCSLPLYVEGQLRIVIVALPGLFSKLSAFAGGSNQNKKSLQISKL